MQLTKNFHQKEFACRCGCGKQLATPRLVEALQKLRDMLDKPIIITSGCRCPKHNRAVGGEINSYHLIGRAADIRVNGMTTNELLFAVKQSCLFTGIGFYPKQNFVHVDTRNRPADWIVIAS